MLDALARHQRRRVDTDATNSAAPAILSAIESCEGSHAVIVNATDKSKLSALALLRSAANERDGTDAARDAEVISSVKWISLCGELPPSRATFRIETESPEAAIQLV